MNHTLSIRNLDTKVNTYYVNFFQLLSLLSEGQEPYYTTQFHGTGIDQAKRIVRDKQGVIPDSPATTTGNGMKGVYLTPNIKLAARYAAGGLSRGQIGRTPAVLEIKLFGSSRHNKMASDPLDRADTAWQDHEDSDGGYGDNPVQELHDDITEFVQSILKRYKITWNKYLRFDFHGLEELQGFDAHGYVRQILEHIFGNNWNSVKNDINRFLNSGALSPGNDYGEGQIVITNNGTMKLTPEYWNRQHQTLYRKTIPHMAVKAVWVRKSDFPNAVGKEQTFGNELLPSEVVSKFEAKKQHLEELGDEVEKIVDSYDEESHQDSIDELEELKTDIEDDKLIYLIDKVIEKINGDVSKLIEKISDRGREMASYLYDNWHSGTTIEENKTVWVRVETKDFNAL